MPTTDRETEHEIVTLVARARIDGWYEDDPGWRQVDQLLDGLGLLKR